MDDKFDKVFSQRMHIAEEELDKQLQSIRDLIEAASEQKHKLELVEQNVKDSVSLIKTLDARFIQKTQAIDADVDDLLKKIRNIEQEVIKKLTSMGGGDDNFTFNFNAHEETIAKMED